MLFFGLAGLGSFVEEPAGHLCDRCVVLLQGCHAFGRHVLHVAEGLLVEHAFLLAVEPDAPGVVVDHVSEEHLARFDVEAELDLDVDHDDVLGLPRFPHVEGGVERLRCHVDHHVVVDLASADHPLFEIFFADGRRPLGKLRIVEDHPAVPEVELDERVVPRVVLEEELDDRCIEDPAFDFRRMPLEVGAERDEAHDHLERDHVQAVSHERVGLAPQPDEVRLHALALQELEAVHGGFVRVVGLALHDLPARSVSRRDVVLALDRDHLGTGGPDDLRLALPDLLRVLQF